MQKKFVEACELKYEYGIVLVFWGILLIHTFQIKNTTVWAAFNNE